MIELVNWEVFSHVTTWIADEWSNAVVHMRASFKIHIYLTFRIEYIIIELILKWIPTTDCFLHELACTCIGPWLFQFPLSLPICVSLCVCVCVHRTWSPPRDRYGTRSVSCVWRVAVYLQKGNNNRKKPFISIGNSNVHFAFWTEEKEEERKTKNSKYDSPLPMSRVTEPKERIYLHFLK